MTARDVMRELQALGARVRRDGDRLILHAGRRPIPQPFWLSGLGMPNKRYWRFSAGVAG